MKPQHRMVLGLVALSGVIFMMSLRDYLERTRIEQASEPAPTLVGDPAERPTMPSQEAAIAAPEAPDPSSPPSGPARQAGQRTALTAPVEMPSDPDPVRREVPIHKATEAANDAAETCIEGWSPNWTNIGSELRIQVELSPTGVVQAHVLEVVGLPGPVLACFGEAMWGAPWPPAPEGLTVPVSVKWDGSVESK